MDEKDKDLAQNGALEGQEEASEVKAQSDGSVNEMGQEGVARGQKTVVLEDEMMVKATKEPVMPVKSPKKSHKGLITTIILTLVLAIGAVTVWLVWGGHEQVTDEIESGTGEVEEDPKTEEENTGNELVDVDLDSLEFYSVFGGFSGFLPMFWLINEGDVIMASDITDETALAWASQTVVAYACSLQVYSLRPIALQQIEGFLSANEHKFSDKDAETEQFEGEINADWWLKYDRCYSGKNLRTRAWELFDRDIVLKDGMTIKSGLFGAMDMYTEELDTLYPWPFFGGGSPGPVYTLAYEAKKSTERMYVKTVLDWCNSDGLMICDNVDYVKEHLSEMDYRFIWTLKKASDGRYVFEKVEKIEKAE